MWIDEERIDEGDAISGSVRAGLGRCRGLIAWVSDDYHESPWCLGELRAAWIAAEAVGAPRDRVQFVLAPGVDPKRLPPARPDADVMYYSAPSDPEGWDRLASVLAGHLPRDGRCLSDLANPWCAPRWLPSRPLLTRRFLGRDKELWQLHALLRADRRAPLIGAPNLELTEVVGPAGVGKSTLALAYATFFQSAWPGGVFWFDVAEHGSPAALLDTLAAHLGIGGPTPEDRSRLLREHFHSLSAPFLWVLDDVPATWDIRRLQTLCAPSAGGATLVTSRAGRWAAAGEVVELDALPEADALLLLLCRRGGVPVESVRDAQSLCEDVGRSPYAIDLLAAMQHLDPVPESEWRRRLSRADEDVLEWATDLAEDLPLGYGKSVSELIRRARADLKHPESADLLVMLAELANQAAPRDVARDILGERGLLRAVSELRSHSLLRWDELSLHALTRRAVARDRATLEARVRIRISLLEQFTTRFERADIDDRATLVPLWPLLPHVEAFTSGRTDSASLRLLFLAAVLWNDAGDYAHAGEACERVLAEGIPALGIDHPGNLELLGNLGKAWLGRGNPGQALAILKPTLARAEETLGADHELVLALRLLVGEAVLQAGDPNEARPHVVAVIDVRRRLGSSRSHEARRADRTLARIEAMTGNVQAAMRIQHALVSELGLDAGAQHRERYQARASFASTLMQAGEIQQALSAYEALIAEAAEFFGADHPETLDLRHNFAGLLLELGDLTQAETIWMQIRDTRVRLLGDYHPETLGSRLNIAICAHADGRYSEARQQLVDVAAAYVRTLGADHPDALLAEQNLARAMQYEALAEHDVSQLASAEALYRSVLDGQRRVLGAESLAALRTAHNLAVVLHQRGDVPAARDMFESNLREFERSLGARHPATNVARHSLVLALVMSGSSADHARARGHLDVLRRLADRDPSTLSADERRILAELPRLSAFLRSRMG